MIKFSQEEMVEIDNLISKLLDGERSNNKEPQVNQFQQKQYYQLPVKHTRGGAAIDDKNKPWIVGHFYPGSFLNETHPEGHNGTDLKAPLGSPVYSIGPGVVTKVIADWKSKYGIENCGDYIKKKKEGIKPATAGNMVAINHEDGKVRSMYLHLDEVMVTSGQKIDMGTVIGTVGETGNAMCRGAHLHYEVRVDGSLVDPTKITNKAVGSLSKKAMIIKEITAFLKRKNK